MSFGYFMNMEKLSLTIVEKHISFMTDDNCQDNCFLHKNKLINNIENGFVVITQLSCYFESFLNTIINTCMKYRGEALLKCSIEEKIDLIFMYYQKDFKDVKSQNPWSIYKKTTKVRNEMIHFKKTYVGHATGIPHFKLGGQPVSEFFTKQNMYKLREGYVKLTELIATALDLKIFKNAGIFESDGRDALVNYVYDDKIIIIDKSRFK